MPRHSPPNDFEPGNAGQIAVAREKWQLVLNAERRNPDVVMKPFAPLGRGGKGGGAKQVAAHENVVPGRLGIGDENTTGAGGAVGLAFSRGAPEPQAPPGQN